ncbi:MAG: hypothetical protein HZA51_18315 [Planctomycetes bacterium]|nr:hypothetical protein [Planctomycetota bacterium]
MSRGLRVFGVCVFSILLALAAAPRFALAQPVCLVSLGKTLYRVNAAGSGIVETFPNQPGNIIGITQVQGGVTVAGCAACDILAVEKNDGGRLWRVDNASSGTPSLVQVGQLEPTVHVASIAFAHGQLYGIGGGGLFHQFDPLTFVEVGAPIHVTTGNTNIGGMAFDGAGTWYITDGGDNNPSPKLYRFPDPPAAASWVALGNIGLTLDNSGLEMYAGQLWGAVRSLDAPSRLLVGTFDMQAGAFTQAWDVAPGSSQSLGFVAIASVAGLRGDINCDGHVDEGDTSPFVLALTNPPGYVTAYPDCSILNADVSGDCMVNGLDIQPFVDQLLGS